VLVDIRAELDFLDIDDLLFLARFIGAFLGFVFVFAVIENLANRRIDIRLNLDKVETGGIGTLKGILDGNNAELLAVFIYTSYLGGRYGAVNTGAGARRCGFGIP
jgi:hypothetical protein